jgi:HEAT repeats
MSLASGSERSLLYLSRVAFLTLPGVLLMGASVRAGEDARYLLWLGSALQVLLFCFFLMTGRIGQGMSHSVIVLYLLGLCWTWITAPETQDWYFHLAQCVLLVVPLLFFALQTLTDSGALASRRARVLAERLANRTEWPVELAHCRDLPEVKALREAMGADATPALALMANERPQVRMAALAALEFRKTWKPGQAELVLHCAQRAKEPAIRAAAVAALANIDDRLLVESLAEFLRDRAPEVRRAAIEAVLWDSERRWAWVRQQVRTALSDPELQGEGPLGPETTLLKAEAITDLEAWATEKGCLGARASQTLAAHYRRALSEHSSSRLVRNLRDNLANVQTPPLLRIELAQILRSSGELDRELLYQLVDSVNPGPLRLIAADALLALDRPATGYNKNALAALRDVARLPNRELALATADVVQRRLGVDLGLAVAQPLPPVHSRLAADVTRRLMSWAQQEEALAKSQDVGEDMPEDIEQSPVVTPPEDTPGRKRKKNGHGSGVFEGLGR